ncbi:LysR family transcriptional regulator [Phaeobacter inhibens]|uniref:LysR family transcriptional regulator n=1 Tax=Phaeobacter inhibens TaxID=221822 RepID=UPI0021A95D30|nr:LysR family transcriptional regulator [Phaeobacter inhibens]UWR47307.1 LysR family transcriptional regulator [Phaeobacter inhibens]UWR64849.1 LysR family transcriptional regulator [Phaeobacter inhibens]UWS00469.1 LysR family transcriptional regulator [Phaeobacter inhibens]UWS04314.1 LysR family transcriptional regulator [Phaeobacter inhibens]
MVRFTLRQLTYLTETARQGGIAQAARQLNVSAAAVASALDKLEAATGLTLFDRFPAQGMRLTRAGETFATQAEALLVQASALDRRAADLASGRAGRIHIGTHHALAQQIVLPVVLAFRENHPGVRIEVKEADYPALVAALDAGEVDALVVFDQGFDPGRHEVEVLLELPPLVLLSGSHPLAAKARISLSDLTGLPYISVSPAGPGPSYLQLLQAAGIHPEVPFQSQSRELVQAYVGKGFGFTLAGFPPKQDCTTEGDPIVARPLKESIGHYRVVIARSRQAVQTALIDRFLEVCRSPISVSGLAGIQSSANL